jgi:hypothetical protein
MYSWILVHRTRIKREPLLCKTRDALYVVFFQFVWRGPAGRG